MDILNEAEVKMQKAIENMEYRLFFTNKRRVA